MIDLIKKLLDPSAINDLTGLAVNSGAAFYAVICLLIGVALVSLAPGKIARYSGAALLCLSAAMMMVTTFGPEPPRPRLEFTIHDAIPKAHGSVALEAIHESDVWMKSKNDQKNYRALFAANTKAPEDSGFLFLVRDSQGEVHRVYMPYCSDPNATFTLVSEEVEIGEQLGIGYDIEPPQIGPCAPTASNSVNLWGAANAQQVRKTVPQVAAPTGLYSTTDVIVRYYDKTADGNAVTDGVERFFDENEFAVEAQNKSDVPLDLIPRREKSKSPDLATNAVWYGTDVPIAVAGQLAAQLIKEGVELQFFGPYKFENTRINTIEAGHSKLNSTKPIACVDHSNRFCSARYGTGSRPDRRG